jgi:hypothetical protein
MARVKQMAEMANLAASRLVGDVDGSTRAAATGALLPADQRATPRAKHAGKGSASRGDRAGMRERPMNVVVAPVASSSGGFVASDDDDAGPSHAEARAQLLRLISQHAGEELLGGDDSSSDDGARLGFGNSPLSDGLLKKLTPPKLAMKEIEARKEAAAREAEELMRRQNAVHELLQTVAKQNESRIKRAKEHMAPDGRSPSQGTVFKPPNSSSDSNDDDATPTAVPAKVVDDDDDARRHKNRGKATGRGGRTSGRPSGRNASDASGSGKRLTHTKPPPRTKRISNRDPRGARRSRWSPRVDPTRGRNRRGWRLHKEGTRRIRRSDGRRLRNSWRIASVNGARRSRRRRRSWRRSGRTARR